MKHEIITRLKADKRERDARRKKLGKGGFEAFVRQIAQTINLAFETGAISSKLGLEGPLRAAIRADLCLSGWRWDAADTMAKDLLAEAHRAVRAERPSWNEGQREWTVEAGTLIERTLCIRCQKPLPERRPKFCNDLCRTGHYEKVSRLKIADEDIAVKLAVTRI